MSIKVLGVVKIFVRFIAVIFIVECIVFLAPFILPSAWYYAYYLGSDSREKQMDLYRGVLPSIPDANAGWKNQPLFSKDMWTIDQWGARTHRPVPLKRTPGVPRVLVIGNSLMNGSNTLPVEESISYYLDTFAAEDGTPIEVMNFANMAFNAGQSYLHLKHNLLQFKPDHVVLGLSESAYAGLGNLFLPFYLLDQRNMPYVKPGFFNVNGELQVKQPPHELAQGNPQALMDFLKAHDDYYADFKRYQHLGMSPVLWTVDYVVQKVRNMLGYFTFDEREFETLFLILQSLEALAQQEGFQVSYVYLPTARAFGESLVWRHMPDFYQQRYTLLTTPNDHHPEGLPIIHVRDVLKADGGDVSSFYQGDLYHFNGKGNRLIAHALYLQLKATFLERGQGIDL